MSENLFRAKNIETGDWVFGHLFLFEDGSYIISSKDSYVETCSRYVPGEYDLSFVICTEVDSKTIGQHTGLLGRFKKELYEGDILYHEIDNAHGVVKYSDGSFCYSCIEYCQCDELNEVAEDLMQIGNIHDDFEWLEDMLNKKRG